MEKYTIYAILPWVKLGRDEPIDIGPIRFIKASEFRNYLDPELHGNFEEYVNKEYAKINARILIEGKIKDINILSIELNDMTCIALDEMQTIILSDQQRDELIFDSIQFLCFLSNLGGFKNNPYALINNMELFLRIGRINKKILNDKKNWTFESWFNHPGRSAEIFSIDKNITNCLGKILLAKFLAVNPRWAQRITRSVHYFNRIFMGRDYVNIIYYGSLPEDAVFLTMAFESLLDVQFASIDNKYTSIKFKNALQSIFNIKYNSPRLILEKWIQGFYDLRSCIVHGDTLPDQIFHDNENVDIPYINLGIKIFIAALICELTSHTCMESNIRQQESEFIEDFYIYLWSQLPLLSSIKELLIEMKRAGKIDKFPWDIVVKIHDLEKMYMEVYCKNDHSFKIKKSNAEKIADITIQIIHIAEEKLIFKGKELRVMDFDNIKINDLSTTEDFINNLKARSVNG